LAEVVVGMTGRLASVRELICTTAVVVVAEVVVVTVEVVVVKAGLIGNVVVVACKDKR
jgi:hypothetical protein